MFILALLVGIYAYAILIIGRLGYLNLQMVSFITGLYIILDGYIIYHYASKHQQEKTSKLRFIHKFINVFKPATISLKSLPLFDKVLIVLIAVAAGIHLVGALGPEIWFDSLWYHLTLPKLYIQNHTISYIKGNLFYYSTMPQLIELLYIPALLFKNEILAKLIHYLFAIGTTYVIFRIGQKLFNIRLGLLAALIFISDLSVGWLTSTAYIDLGRTFFEVVAFSIFLKWWEDRNPKDLIKSGLIAGLAVSTKYMALGTVGIIAILIFKYSKKHQTFNTLIYIASSLATSAYWFIYAFINTGNPIYPIFTHNLDSSHELVFHGPLDFFTSLFKLSNLPHDWLSPISPLYLLLIPFALYFLFRKGKSHFPIKRNSHQHIQLLAWFSGFAALVWLFTPNTGGSRFIVPYLPAFALLAVSVLTFKQVKDTKLEKVIIASILIVASGNLLLRMYVNTKNIPVILGIQSKHDYLAENLNFGHAFFDLNGEIQQIIKPTDKVFLYAGHSLYYYPFELHHESFAERDDSYDYIIVQAEELNDEAKQYEPLYVNPITHTYVYKTDDSETIKQGKYGTDL